LTEKRIAMTDSFGANWLELAVLHDEKATVQHLLEAKAFPEHKDEDRSSPLYIAAQHGRIDIITLLQSHGASLTTKNGKIGSTCLHVAAQQGQLATVIFLLKEGMDPNSKADNGYTPLHAATRGNHIDVLRFLLKSKSKIDSLSDNQTPLLQAALVGNVNAVKALIMA